MRSHKETYGAWKADDAGIPKALKRYRENGVPPIRNKRAVWHISSVPSVNNAHFAVFPEKLVEPMILGGCPQDGIVIDPFVGSGTTAWVARRLQRHYVGIDINPEYCAIAEKRLAEML